MSAACCWGQAEGEGRQITEGEEPKDVKAHERVVMKHGSASGAEFNLMFVCTDKIQVNG